MPMTKPASAYLLVNLGFKRTRTNVAAPAAKMMVMAHHVAGFTMNSAKKVS